MAPYGNGQTGKAQTSRELQGVNQFQGGKIYPKMAETSVVVDPCAANKICSSKKAQMSDSTTSLHSCSCGPECGPDKCDGRKSTTLVAWDDTRTKIFILLIVAFSIWLLIYIPISVTTMNDSSSDGGHEHHHARVSNESYDSHKHHIHEPNDTSQNHHHDHPKDLGHHDHPVNQTERSSHHEHHPSVSDSEANNHHHHHS